MRKISKTLMINLFLISLLTMLVGCREDGTFIFNNNSNHETRITIDRSSSTISPNSTYERNWSLSYSIFGVDDRNFDLTVRSRIFIWNDTTERVRVRAGSTNRKRVSDFYDAAGLDIINDSNSFTITHVYISPATDMFWGDNKLSGTIRPGNNRLWNISDGKWDILIVDNWGDEFAIFDVDFRIGQLRYYRYTGFTRVSNADQLKRVKVEHESCRDNENYKVEPI